MKLSNYNPSSRYKKRSRERMMTFLKWLIVFVVFAGGGFFFGKAYNQNVLSASRARLELLEKERSDLITEVTDLRAIAQTADARYESIQQAYESAVPSDEVQGLIGLLHKQLAEGVSVERLQQAVGNAQRPRQCSDPQTHRFVVFTPSYEGAESSVSLDDGAVVVKASGVSVVNEEGKDEAWYDPTKKVMLEFSLPDGEVDMKEGMMPFDHSIVLGKKEYRFSVAEGAKSFVKLTYDVCDAL